MSTEKWIAGSGQGLTYGPLFGSELNPGGVGLASGNAVLSSVAVTNGTPLDMFMDISISLGSITPTGTPYIAFYLYALNQDGSTYGDGRFTSSTNAQPPGTFYSGTIPLVASAGVQVGTVRGVVLPPGTFKMVVFNFAGVAFAGSSNTIAYRTYNRVIA